jgi:hypothetical protein
MTIDDLIRLAENRLATINGAWATAFARGESEAVAKLEAEITQTQETLDTLRSVAN